MTDSLEKQLLYSSLLCGLKPTGNPAYRLQLFFIANKDLGSKSHQSAFQRVIETGVYKRLWINYGEKGSGEYLFTELGYKRAKQLCGDVKPIYPPVKGKDYHIFIKGEIKNLFIEIKTKGNSKNSTRVYINHKLIKTSKEACNIIERNTNIPLKTTDESAVRVLYNFAIDYNFDLIWKGTIF